MPKPVSTRAPKIIGWIALVLDLIPILCLLSTLSDILRVSDNGKGGLWDTNPAVNAGMIFGFFLIPLVILFPLAYSIVFLVILKKNPDLQLTRSQSRFLLTGFILMIFSILMEFLFSLTIVVQPGSTKSIYFEILSIAFIIIPLINLYLIITGLYFRRVSKRKSKEELINAFE